MQSLKDIEDAENKSFMRWAFALLIVLMVILFTLATAGSYAKASPPVQGAKAVVVDNKAEDLAAVMTWARKHGKHRWGKSARYLEYAKLFVKNGRRWKVDPLLVACVAFAESRFRVTAPPLYLNRCKTVLQGCNRPGPCHKRVRWKKVCKRTHVNTEEAGMMQVLWYDGSTRKGYAKCTGKKLVRRARTRTLARARAHKQLMPPKVAICVGTYEMSQWKRWAYVGGYGRIRCHTRKSRGSRYCANRLKPRKKRNVSFFKKHPQLKRHFWVSFYNWGSNNWAGNFYPRFVLGCYKRFKDRMAKRVVARLRRQTKIPPKAKRVQTPLLPKR